MFSSRRVAVAARAITGNLLGAASLWIAASTPATAQDIGDESLRVPADTTTVQEIELASGTKLVGRIVEIEAGRLVFRTLEGLEVTLRVAQVRAVRVLEGVRSGPEFWPRDPSDSRLFLGPTARVVGDRRGYVGIYELFFPSAAVGVGDVAMVSGGMSIFPGLPLSDQFFFFSPKVRLLGNDQVGAAAGLFWFGVGASDDSGGLVYTVLTAENEAGAVTLGPAFPFMSDGGFTDEFLGMIGGEIRLSRSVKFISENWFVGQGEGAFLTFGARLLESRYTIEAAALIPTDGEAVLPLVSFSMTW